MSASYSTVCARFGKRAQQVFENICEVESSKRLKIRVSLVRFQSRPPLIHRSSSHVATVFSFKHTAAHSSHTFLRALTCDAAGTQSAQCLQLVKFAQQRASV